MFVGDLRSRHVGVSTAPSSSCRSPRRSSISTWTDGRRRSRSSSTIPTMSMRCSRSSSRRPQRPGLHRRLAPAQRDLLLGAAGRAQRHVHDPDADRAGRGAQHHFGPDHAGEGQGPRHRHPAHHGRDARRDPAHLPDDGCSDRRHRHHRRRHPRRALCLNVDRSASSSPGCPARCCSIPSSISSASCRPRWT